MLAILNKIDSNAVQNFKRTVDPDLLKNMSLDEARRLCNLLIWHTSESRKIFDLEDGKYPDPGRDKVLYKKRIETRKKEKKERRASGWLFSFWKQQKSDSL